MRVLGFVVVDTHRWLIVAEVAQMHRQAVCIGSLAVFTTEDEVALCWANSPTQIADTLPCIDDALTHIHTPMLESQVLHTAAR